MSSCQAGPMLRVGVVSIGEPAASAAARLQQHGIDVDLTGALPVALAVVFGPADAEADVVLPAHDLAAAADAASELFRTRLGPWARALASDRPDVTAPPHLVAHDEDWAPTAARRGRAVRAALAALDPADQFGLRRIDHIGSTAVPGLAAKSFLDLQVTLDRVPDAAALAAALAPLGWAPAVGARPDSPGVHRDMRMDDDVAPDEAFAKRLLVAPDPLRPAILHVRLTASPFARRVVRFRDQLRADPELRRSYTEIKQRAAAAHSGDADFDDYTRDKSAWLIEAYRHVDAAAGSGDPWPLDP